MDGVDYSTVPPDSMDPQTLPQEPLAATRNSFKKDLPSCADWNTKELIVNECFFKKPGNCPSNPDEVDLDLSKVTAITFSPVLLDTSLQGTVELKEVVCYSAGEIGNTAIQNVPLAAQHADLTINKITPQLIRATVPFTGNYSIALFDIKERTVTSPVNGILTKGARTVTWDSGAMGATMYKTGTLGIVGRFITL